MSRREEEEKERKQLGVGRPEERKGREGVQQMKGGRKGVPAGR